MKIAFICSSAAPGRDGVGDYTRRLATACAELGHQCLVLAINDRHLSTTVASTGRGPRSIHRWPATLPWSERRRTIHQQLDQFAPDCISWQMVSYGYHPKGILVPEVIDLARELRASRTHVMLHELWIGLSEGESWWARFVGWRQRRALFAFLRAAEPNDVQTSNGTYVAALARHGCYASILPLFSNIPIVPATSPARDAAIARYLPAATEGQHLVSVTFGTLHPQWHPEASARFIRETAARHGRQPALLAIGRTGAHGPSILREMARSGIPVAATGELPPRVVSCLLQAANFGIASHPLALVKKSGVVAAMLDHGLPVLLPRDDWRLRHGPAPNVTSMDPRLARLEDLSGDNVDAWLRRRHSPGDSFPTTVGKFLHTVTP